MGDFIFHILKLICCGSFISPCIIIHSMVMPDESLVVTTQYIHTYISAEVIFCTYALVRNVKKYTPQLIYGVYINFRVVVITLKACDKSFVTCGRVMTRVSWYNYYYLKNASWDHHNGSARGAVTLADLLLAVTIVCLSANDQWI